MRKLYNELIKENKSEVSKSDLALAELEYMIPMRRRGLITRQEWRAKMREIENTLFDD